MQRLGEWVIKLLISTLVILAKAWQIPKCPILKEWLTEHWYIHTLE